MKYRVTYLPKTGFLCETIIVEAGSRLEAEEKAYKQTINIYRVVAIKLVH